MKKLKQLFTVLLTIAMLGCMGAAALAAEQDPEIPETELTDMETVIIKKIYTLTGAGTSPAETFTLEQVGDGVVRDGDAESAPALGTITGASFVKGAASAAGANGNITIALPEYDHVGIYEYTLREAAGTTAGVAYYAKDIKLVVTVINDANGSIRVAAVHTEIPMDEGNKEGTKSDSFTNTYSAGTLNVTKTVEGNLGNKDKKFDFTLVLTKEQGKTVGEIRAFVAGTEVTDFDPVWNADTNSYQYTFQLAHGETASFTNLPYGTSYTVTEAAADGYETTKTGDTGSISAALSTAAFVNTKDGEIDMGVSLDSLPYLLILMGTAAAGILFAVRRRTVE